MKLRVLASGSSGNCYLLDGGDEILMLECGIRFSEVKQAIDFQVSRIVGCLITHEHGDHCVTAKEVEQTGIPVWTGEKTAEAIGLRYGFYLKSGQAARVGNFQVLPFDVVHGAVEPLGFLIRHADMGTVLFATDLGYSPYRFEGLNHVLIECNYSEDILEKRIASGSISRTQLKHVIEGHLSLRTCQDILKLNDLSAVRNIVLLHLSDGNSDQEAFQKEIQNQTGKPVYIAARGLELELGEHPF